jgi:hypothetical protein
MARYAITVRLFHSLLPTDLHRRFRTDPFGLTPLYGAPLVLKADNGSAFIDHRVLDLLRTWNVKILYSPVAYPQYNGFVKNRSDSYLLENACMFAAWKLRSHAWIIEDVLNAKNRLNRLEKGLSPFYREQSE